MSAKQPYRDATWWKQFEAAPPELRKAMHETMKARDDLKGVKRMKVDDDVVLRHERKVEELAAREAQLRDALRGAQPRLPVSRKVQGIREAWKHQRERDVQDRPGGPIEPIDLDNL